MADAPFTEREVKELLKAKKYILRTVQDNRTEFGRNPNINEIRLRYEIRRKDGAASGLHLHFFARQERPLFAALPRLFPGVSLNWYGWRIRCIAHKLRRDVVQNGLVIGFVKDWYEHQWTDADQDRFVVDINSEVKRTDFASMVKFSLKRWNIEAAEQLDLGE